MIFRFIGFVITDMGLKIFLMTVAFSMACNNFRRFSWNRKRPLDFQICVHPSALYMACVNICFLGKIFIFLSVHPSGTIAVPLSNFPSLDGFRKHDVHGPGDYDSITLITQ